MKKSLRLSLSTTICFIALFMFASHVYAIFDSNVKKAKEFMQAGMYPQAIALLEKEINEEPTNDEAHFQLGICYINQNNYSGADERFASAVKLKPDYGYEIGKEFKKASDEALKIGNLSSASSLFDKAIIYDPRFKKLGYNFYMSLGDKTQSVHYYERALQYAQEEKEKKMKIGFKFLRLAAREWPGSRCESLKQNALGLVGEKIVQEVFPSPYMKIIFEQSYTDADADAEGHIYTFPWNLVQRGDLVEVIGKIPEGAEEIQYWRGKKFKPKWHKTVNGYFNLTVKQVPSWGKSVISMEQDKGIRATVRIKRKTIPKPNINLISSYLNE